MTMQGRRGGRPLVAMVAILAAWIAIRASLWELPFDLPPSDGLFANAQADRAEGAHRVATTENAGAIQSGALQRLPDELAAVQRSAHFTAIEAQIHATHFDPAVPSTAARSARPNLSANHQLLYAAAFAFMPPYDHLATDAQEQGKGWSLGAALPLRQRPSRAARDDRWSADAWLLLREGGSGLRLASVHPAGYGGDQIGAVARYSLSPNSALEPQAYARASKALVPGGETEAAAGVSIGLARSFPLRVHGELRVTDRPEGTELHPAAYLVTGLPRRKVGPMLEAESYLQAGYVGGAYETGFVDGRATLEAPVIRANKGRVAIGGGVWGGAQRDAARLDLGPTASAIVTTGRASFRGSVDYRVRIAGDAVPGDGLAVTLAASF